MCIQQTHLSSKYQPVIPNYTIITKHRLPQLGKGGGQLKMSGVNIGGVSVFNVYNPPSNSFALEAFGFLSAFRNVVL